jgi:hypothetical protein
VERALVLAVTAAMLVLCACRSRATGAAAGGTAGEPTGVAACDAYLAEKAKCTGEISLPVERDSVTQTAKLALAQAAEMCERQQNGLVDNPRCPHDAARLATLDALLAKHKAKLGALAAMADAVEHAKLPPVASKDGVKLDGPPISIRGSIAASPNNGVKVELAGADALATKLASDHQLSTCVTIAHGGFHNFVAKDLAACEALAYVAVVRVAERVAPVLSGQTFKSGSVHGDVVFYSLTSGKELGAARFGARNSLSVSTTASRQPRRTSTSI